MAAIGLGGQPLQHGEGEPGGLAGAGLRRAEQVAAGEDDRNRLDLDRGGNGVALLGYGACKLGIKAEAFERRTDGFLLSTAWEGGTFDRFRQMLFLACYSGPGWAADNGLRR
jgi:hypothetical protein